MNAVVIDFASRRTLGGRQQQRRVPPQTWNAARCQADIAFHEYHVVVARWSLAVEIDIHADRQFEQDRLDQAARELATAIDRAVKAPVAALWMSRSKALNLTGWLRGSRARMAAKDLARWEAALAAEEAKLRAERGRKKDKAAAGRA
jgi:hypothetical protein